MGNFMNAMYLMYLCILPWNHGSLAENICFEDTNSYLPAVTMVIATNHMASSALTQKPSTEKTGAWRNGQPWKNW